LFANLAGDGDADRHEDQQDEQLLHDILPVRRALLAC
jgi:hypothetical protein